MSIGQNKNSSSGRNADQKPAGGAGQQGNMTRTGPAGDPTGAPFGDDQREGQEQGGQAQGGQARSDSAGQQDAAKQPQERERGGGAGQR